jgi:CxC6 like cysteine cluster associated with KDZ transposases
MDGNASGDSNMSVDSEQDKSIEMANSKVQMVATDGIVMGPKHCAYADCTNDLINYTTGVFCAVHKAIQGNLYCVQTCQT